MFAAQVGSTVVTKASVRRPPKPPRHQQLDYKIWWPELPAVEKTAATWENLLVQAVDASACWKKTAELTAVKATSAPELRSLTAPGHAHLSAQRHLILDDFSLLDVRHSLSGSPTAEVRQ